MTLKYAVKIGEVHLHSDKPITQEQRKEAVQRLLNGGGFELRSQAKTDDVLVVVDNRP